ncbi:hypothetical protein M2271_000126 [Streptomyces sp. LBL]|nr:hypothetical protein [Streptomyces sp. LBL]
MIRCLLAECDLTVALTGRTGPTPINPADLTDS